MLPTSRGFWKAFLLTLITAGFYQWYLVYAFAKETNTACAEDGRKTSGLVVFLLLSIITFGIYSIVWYYGWIGRCDSYLFRHNRPRGLQTSTYLLSVFFGGLTLGIFNLIVFCKMLYLQNAVNETYNTLNFMTSEAPAAPFAAQGPAMAY